MFAGTPEVVATGVSDFLLAESPVAMTFGRPAAALVRLLLRSTTCALMGLPHAYLSVAADWPTYGLHCGFELGKHMVLTTCRATCKARCFEHCIDACMQAGRQDGIHPWSLTVLPKEHQPGGSLGLIGVVAICTPLVTQVRHTRGMSASQIACLHAGLLSSSTTALTAIQTRACQYGCHSGCTSPCQMLSSVASRFSGLLRDHRAVILSGFKTWRSSARTQCPLVVHPLGQAIVRREPVLSSHWARLEHGDLVGDTACYCAVLCVGIAPRYCTVELSGLFAQLTQRQQSGRKRCVLGRLPAGKAGCLDGRHSLGASLSKGGTDRVCRASYAADCPHVDHHGDFMARARGKHRGSRYGCHPLRPNTGRIGGSKSRRGVVLSVCHRLCTLLYHGVVTLSGRLCLLQTGTVVAQVVPHMGLRSATRMVSKLACPIETLALDASPENRNSRFMAFSSHHKRGSDLHFCHLRGDLRAPGPSAHRFRDRASEGPSWAAGAVEQRANAGDGTGGGPQEACEIKNVARAPLSERRVSASMGGGETAHVAGIAGFLDCGHVDMGSGEATRCSDRTDCPGRRLGEKLPSANTMCSAQSTLPTSSA